MTQGHKKFTKFFNHMNKWCTDYGPRKLFEPIPGEANAPSQVLFPTRTEDREFGIGTSKHDSWCLRSKEHIVSARDKGFMTCAQVAQYLNEIGHQTVPNHLWTKRLVAVFMGQYMTFRLPEK